jgi:hypothetical protein
MKYRIVKKTMRNGNSEFWIQKKFLFFWIYVDQMVGYGSYSYIVFNNYEEAKDYMQSLVNQDYSTYNSKVIKKEIVK